MAEGRGGEGIFSLPLHPDQLWSSSSPLSKRYQGFFTWG